MIRVKVSERRPFIFISRLNIVQRDSYQADGIVMEIEEWKQNVADGRLCQKSFTRYVGDINSILKKLYEFSLCCSDLSYSILEFRVFGVRFLKIL